MPAREAPFPCTLLRDYPPEDLWAGFLVFGQRQADGRIYLSEYCEKDGQRLGAAFEDNARQGFHFSMGGQASTPTPGRTTLASCCVPSTEILAN